MIWTHEELYQAGPLKDALPTELQRCDKDKFYFKILKAHTTSFWNSNSDFWLNINYAATPNFKIFSTER